MKTIELIGMVAALTVALACSLDTVQAHPKKSGALTCGGQNLCPFVVSAAPLCSVEQCHTPKSCAEATGFSVEDCKVCGDAALSTGVLCPCFDLEGSPGWCR